MAAVGGVLLYCQNFSCRCDMHLNPRLVPAVVISRLKTINVFKYNDRESLGRFCSASFRCILRSKCVRPAS